MSLEGQSQWYVAHTHPRGEAKAAMHLNRQGFGVYLPRYLKRTRHARRTEIVPAAFFPRYLFVRIDMATQRWRAIQSTLGVSNLVCRGDEPTSVPVGIIDELRRREDERGFVTLDRRPAFLPGDKVSVVEGVFSTCGGLFEGTADRERVIILLDLLGRKVRVTIDSEAVAAA
jgi:transcriptional antiterminator RfaH